MRVQAFFGALVVMGLASGAPAEENVNTDLVETIIAAQ